MRKSSRFKFLLLILAIIAIIVVLLIVDQVREHPEYAPMYTESGLVATGRKA